jgi:hypothetical protein
MQWFGVLHLQIMSNLLNSIECLSYRMADTKTELGSKTLGGGPHVLSMTWNGSWMWDLQETLHCLDQLLNMRRKTTFLVSFPPTSSLFLFLFFLSYPQLWHPCDFGCIYVYASYVKIVNLADEIVKQTMAVKCHVSSAYFRSSLHGADQIFVHGSCYIKIWLFERIKIIECPKNKTVKRTSLGFNRYGVMYFSRFFSVGTVSWPYSTTLYTLILHRALNDTS